LAIAEVAATDLDIAIVGQLPAARLALDDKLEAGSMQMVRLRAFLGRHGAIDVAPEDIARHADHALVLADADANSTAGRSGFHRASSGKLKNMAQLDRYGFLFRSIGTNAA
jgi:hypothetical protein